MVLVSCCSCSPALLFVGFIIVFIVVDDVDVSRVLATAIIILNIS